MLCIFLPLRLRRRTYAPLEHYASKMQSIGVIDEVIPLCTFGARVKKHSAPMPMPQCPSAPSGQRGKGAKGTSIGAYPEGVRGEGKEAWRKGK